MTCELKQDSSGAKYIMILNASKIELIDQMVEDISKTLKFSVTGMKTTDISGTIAIKFK